MSDRLEEIRRRANPDTFWMTQQQIWWKSRLSPEDTDWLICELERLKADRTILLAENERLTKRCEEWRKVAEAAVVRVSLTEDSRIIDMFNEAAKGKP